jgi:hypothetical protein
MHPDLERFVEVEAPIPEDMRLTLDALRGSGPTDGKKKGLDKR